MSKARQIRGAIIPDCSSTLGLLTGTPPVGAHDSTSCGSKRGVRALPHFTNLEVEGITRTGKRHVTRGFAVASMVVGPGTARATLPRRP